MIWAFLTLSVLINVGMGLLLFRATRRLLQFDDIWRSILPELQSYTIDLKKMASGDVLQDHPEVVKFHRRNLRALKALESIVDSIVNEQPAVPPQPALPRPEAE